MHFTKNTQATLLICAALFAGCSDTAEGNNGNNGSNNGGTSQTTNNGNTISNNTSSTTQTSGTTSGPQAPLVSNLPTFNVLAVKLFRFGWNDVADATHYQLLENVDGVSEFLQVGEDILPGVKTMDIEVPLHLRTQAVYKLRSCNEVGCTDSDPVEVAGNLAEAIGYFKSGNSDADDQFGTSISLSDDGVILAVGAPEEDSRSTDDERDNAWTGSGAVYIFTQTNGKWVQQTMLKSSNADMFDGFGSTLKLSGAGDVLAVGAPSEDGGVLDDPNDNSRRNAGALYIFERSGSTWTQVKYIKVLTEYPGSHFASRLDLSADGNSVISYDRNANSDGEAVTLFTKVNGEWTRQPGFNREGAVYLNYGASLSISGDGTTIAVGAEDERGADLGIGGDPDNIGTNRTGAVFLYEKNGDTWNETYIKADAPLSGGIFGRQIKLSQDGNTLAVLGQELVEENSIVRSKTVYVYRKTDGEWKLSKKFKTDEYSGAFNMALNPDGTLLAFASADQSPSAGLNGDRTPEAAGNFGSVLLYKLQGDEWKELSYIKASNPGSNDSFGRNLLIGKNDTLVISAPLEKSASTGVDGDQNNEDAEFSGAVYLY